MPLFSISRLLLGAALAILTANVSSAAYRGEMTIASSLLAGGGIAQSASPLYLFSTFDNSDSKRPYGLILSTSTDGLHWSPMTTTYSYTDSNVRDPSWIKIADTYYVTYTLAFPTITNSFRIIKSKDLINWSIVATPSIQQVPNGQAWAPEWFYDNSTGQYYIVVAGVEPAWSPMKPYILNPTSSDFTTWSEAREITGTNFPAKVIDSWIEKQNGIYYLFYCNNDTGYIEVATSTHRESGYTVIKTGDWAGWGGALQGPSLLHLPDGRWRLYLDRYSTINNNKTVYAESATSDLATTTWSTITGLTSMMGFVGLCEHGTIREFIPTYHLFVTADPSEGAILSGAGAVDRGVVQVVSATPSTAYTFLNWTEGGTVVSTLPSYSFTVLGDRNLVANLVMKPFYQWWSASTTTGVSDPTVSGPDATPQHDGTPNVLKYLCHIDPSLPMSETDKAALPEMRVIQANSKQYLCLRHRKNSAASNLIIEVQVSTDLKTWTTITPDFTQTVETDSSTGDPVIEYQVDTQGATQKFIRLNVTVP